MQRDSFKRTLRISSWWKEDHQRTEALLPGEVAQQEFQTELLVAFGKLLLYRSLFQLLRQRQDRGDHLPQACHLPHQALHFLTLTRGQCARFPPAELLLKEPQVTLLYGIHFSHAPNSEVVEYMGFWTRLLQQFILFLGCLQHPIDVRRDQWKPCDGLPLRDGLFRHFVSSREFSSV